MIYYTLNLPFLITFSNYFNTCSVSRCTLFNDCYSGLYTLFC